MHNAQVPQQEELYQSKNALNTHELQRVADFIGAEVGIQLPASKHTLVEGRLRKRVRSLGFEDFKSYLDYTLDSAEGENERLHLIDAITTNKTEFFREPEHFDYLVNKALPQLEHNRKCESRRELNIWSAGCSSGEEPYTLSMVLHEAAEKSPGLRFSILGTDISNKCLQKASRGVYTEARIESVELHLRKKYLLRSQNSDDDLVMIGPEVSGRVRFGSLNLMDSVFSLRQKMDVIFCRNVMIYFSNKIREELVSRFEKQLLPGGYLFVGHSESLNGINTRLQQVAPMVYKKS